MRKKPSYDDIIRDVVPLPDSSHRPHRDEALAAESRSPGPHITSPWPDDDQRPSTHAIHDALLQLVGADLSDLDVSIDGGRATIEGSVAREDDRDRIVRATSAVPGVVTVINKLRIRT